MTYNCSTRGRMHIIQSSHINFLSGFTSTFIVSLVPRLLVAPPTESLGKKLNTCIIDVMIYTVMLVHTALYHKNNSNYHGHLSVKDFVWPLYICRCCLYFSNYCLFLSHSWWSLPGPSLEITHYPGRRCRTRRLLVARRGINQRPPSNTIQQSLGYDFVSPTCHQSCHAVVCYLYAC